MKKKYKIGDKVYVRTYVHSSGMEVFYCEIIKDEHWETAGYMLKTINNKENHRMIALQHEISKRKEKLIKKARKKIEEKYSDCFDSYNNYHKKLDEL